MLIVAHRGGNPDDIENSAAAFRHGVEIGADLIECDLQLSASGDIVVYHDTEHFGAPIRNFTTDELRGLIPTILTLDELLALLEDIGPETRLVLDLKDRDVDRALELYLQDSELRQRSLVTSTFSFGLLRLRRAFPDLRTGLSRGAIFTRVPGWIRPLAIATVGRATSMIAIIHLKVFGIDTAVVQHHLVDGGGIGRFHRRGIRVYAWTIDEPARATRLQDLGVDYLTTNVPARMIEHFKNR